MRIRKNETGFTVAELMTVVMIIALVGAIALPVMSRMLPNQQLKAATRGIISAMTQAKSEAIRRGARVALIFPDPAKFNAGDPMYRMFVDNGMGPVKPDGSAEVVGKANGNLDAGEEVLFTAAPLPARVVPNPKKRNGQNANFCEKNTLVFNERGLPVGACGGFGGGSIRLCVADSQNNPSEPCRLVTVSSAGRVTGGLD